MALTPEYRELLDVVQLPDGPGGAMTSHELVRVWKPICGTPRGVVDELDLQLAALVHDMTLRDQGYERVSSEGPFSPRGGVDVVFNVNFTGAPVGAAGAFTKAEQYLQSLTSDVFTVTLDVTFSALPSQTLGITSTIFLTNISYTNSRTGLFNNRDADDFLPFYLPSVTVPTRFNALSSTVTNVSQIDWPVSLYNATVAPFSNSSGSMQLSNSTTWDVDPTNGITAGTYSLVDVIIHEVGHAMGFVTKADASEDGKLFPQDLFRFASVDRAGLGNTNPTSLQEFTSVAREVDFDAPSNGGVEFNLIAGEIDMSDGDPYQAAHLKQESSNPTLALGQMQPVLGTGVTFAPNYFREADLIVLDAMGWDIFGVPMITNRRQSALDWNRDGWPDILWDGAATTPPGRFISTHFPGSSPTFTFADQQLAASGWRRVAVNGDLNGDGWPDIIWQNATSLDYAIWLMVDGSISNSWFFPALWDSRWRIQTVGDLDGDGFDDIIWRNPETGSNTVWYMNNLGFRSWSFLLPVGGPEWSCVAVGNFIGNDDNDLIWRNTVTGQNIIWEMDNNDTRSFNPITTVGPWWRIKGVGDWNGDQQTDIFWWDTSTGNTAWWFMDGIAFSYGAAGPNIPATFWQ